MVDIKRQDITLQDWTKGISADEFAWGSYFYSEWIQSWYTTKGFKLGHRLDSSVLNYRSNGYAVDRKRWIYKADNWPNTCQEK